MKATLEFNLPEETEDFETASNGWKFKSVLYELETFLRSKVKYEELKEGEYEVYYKVRDHLWELVNEEKLDLY